MMIFCLLMLGSLRKSGLRGIAVRSILLIKLLSAIARTVALCVGIDFANCAAGLKVDDFVCGVFHGA